MTKDDGERLQFGRDRGNRQKPVHRGQSSPVDGTGNVFKRLWERRRRRRAATKARVAAMSRRRRVARWLMIGGTWLLGFIAVLMVALIIMYYEFTNVPRPESLPLPQVATIQYSDGSTLATFGSVDRTIVHIGQVPLWVQNAVIAAEDRGFRSEPGISITGTIRAALNDLTGGNTQGGSGITQQYVKNAYLTNSQTIIRKLKELMIAVKLSHEYSKDQILEFYLNTVYFGRGAYGIEAAAKAYFGKNVWQLDIAQGALLAALLRAPSYYDPANNLQAATQRWQYVRDGMVAINAISASQAAQLTFPKTIKPKPTGIGSDGWKYILVQAVLADLQAHGISKQEVTDRGLIIRTTIDKKAQMAAVSAINQTFSNLTKQQHNLKNALTAVDPTSGAVLAYYGGSGPGVKGYDGKVDFNDYAGNGGRPPGSSFKPYTLATVLGQTLHQTPGRDHLAINSYVPGDFCRTIDGTRICNDPGDRTVSGPRVKLALAMKYSLNTTFDLLALDAGPDNVAATAHAMGIAPVNSYGQKTLVDSNGNTSFGIGIGDYPVTPLDQATGFATLANGGVENQPYLVQEARASDGKIVYQHQAHSQQAIDKRVANDVTLTLEPIASYSGDGLANGRQSAAKTGTEGLSPKSPNNSDAWMVGYTPQVSAAVWVGTGYNRPIYNAAGLPEYGADLPGKTWKLFMDTYLGDKPQMQMTDVQMISTNGSVPSTPTPTVPLTSASSSPSPTFSVTSGFPTPTPSRTRTRTPSPTPTPTPTHSTCTPTVLHSC